MPQLPLTGLPILSDLASLEARLALEERELLQKLALLEDQVRRFEDRDRPAYEAWLRIEFGPKLAALEEVHERIRVMRVLVHRVEELVERRSLHPREALYVANGGREEDAPENAAFDEADEIEARRRAKKEAKRDARKDAKKAARETRQEKHQETRRTDAKLGAAASNPAFERLEQQKVAARSKLVALYRLLARKLHPDSSQFIASDRSQRLWLEVQAAYEASDFERLLSVAAWLGQESASGDEFRVPSLTLSDRYERNRALGVSKYRLQKNVARLTEHPAWGFGVKSGESGKRTLRKQAAREIDRELERAQEALQAYEDFVESIGPPRPPSKTGAGRGKHRRP